MLIGLCAVVGLAVGSFLNVVIWRVPRGESVVRPPSHCPRCGTGLRARDNVPVLSWVLLRGRCRGCAERIAWQYPAVEVLTAALFAGVAARFGASVAMPAFLYLVAVGLALAAIDISTHRLPDVLTLPSYVVGVVLLAGAASLENHPGVIVRSLLAMVVLFGFYGLLWFLYPKGMGRGDVKLAGVLGLYLGYLGWAEVAVGTFAGFLLGGIFGGSLMAAGKATRKSKIPFGPFMVVGTLVAIYAGAPIAHLYRHLVFD